jgi:hypothetical protein
LGFRVQGLGFRCISTACFSLHLGFRVQGFAGVWRSGFRISLGFRV